MFESGCEKNDYEVLDLCYISTSQKLPLGTAFLEKIPSKSEIFKSGKRTCGKWYHPNSMHGHGVYCVEI